MWTPTFVRPAVVLLVAVTLLVEHAAAQTFSSGGPLVVRDASGDLVGELVGGAEVSVTINGHPTVLRVHRNELTDFGAGLYFDGPGCTGNAFIHLNSVVLAFPHVPAYFAPDGTVRISPSTTTTTQAMVSHYHHPTRSCFNESETLANALATEMGPNLQAQFQGPFTTGVGQSFHLAEVPFANRDALILLGGALAIFGVFVLRR